MTGALAIFVKTPGISPIKTRLAVNLGIKRAEAFHKASAQVVSAVAKTAGRFGNFQSYYAVAEQEALNDACWRDLPCLWQEDGGLGERMASVYQTLLRRHDFVMLVGADSPQMAVSELFTASAWLSQDDAARFVLGPSYDGGFWLFGGNRSVPSDLWTQVTYSQADTGSQFLSRIEPLGEVKILLNLRDIDEIDDLLALPKTLQALVEPLSEQRALIELLDTFIDGEPRVSEASVRFHGSPAV